MKCIEKTTQMMLLQGMLRSQQAKIINHTIVPPNGYTHVFADQTSDLLDALLSTHFSSHTFSPQWPIFILLATITFFLEVLHLPHQIMHANPHNVGLLYSRNNATETHWLTTI
jgi:hypothetical protein